MDNAQKAIMIGVGLFITIIIISAVLLILNLGDGLIGDGTAELATMSSSLQQQIYNTYDNKVLSGVQIRTTLQQYLNSKNMVVVLIGGNQKIVATIGNNDKIAAVWWRADNSTWETYTTYFRKSVTSVNGVHKTSMNEFTNVRYASTSYIEPTGSFQTGVLTMEQTDTIVGIVIAPEGFLKKDLREINSY